MSVQEPAESSRIDQQGDLSTVATLRRGLELSPEIRQGLLATIGLAIVATVGRVVIPFVVQQATDNGIMAEGGVDVGFVMWAIALAAGVVLVTSIAQYFVNVRLFTAAESGLATLRLKAFRQIGRASCRERV